MNSQTRITIDKYDVDEVTFDDLPNLYPHGGVEAFDADGDTFHLYVPEFGIELIWHREG